MSIRNPETLRTIKDGITNRFEFRAPSTLSGEWEDGPLYMGRMSSDEQDRMRKTTRDVWIVYVVRSYNTPIAWYVAGSGWHITTDKHSATTNHHTRIIRDMLSM